MSHRGPDRCPDEETANDEGRAAYRTGRASFRNPYDEPAAACPNAFDAWDDGWNAERRASERREEEARREAEYEEQRQQEQELRAAEEQEMWDREEAEREYQESRPGVYYPDD